MPSDIAPSLNTHAPVATPLIVGNYNSQPQTPREPHPSSKLLQPRKNQSGPTKNFGGSTGVSDAYNLEVKTTKRA
jgi:hypothetical protein